MNVGRLVELIHVFTENLLLNCWWWVPEQCLPGGQQSILMVGAKRWLRGLGIGVGRLSTCGANSQNTCMRLWDILSATVLIESSCTWHTVADITSTRQRAPAHTKINAYYVRSTFILGLLLHFGCRKYIQKISLFQGQDLYALKRKSYPDVKTFFPTWSKSEPVQLCLL